MMQKTTTFTTIFRVKKCYFHYYFACKKMPLSLPYAKKIVMYSIFLQSTVCTYLNLKVVDVFSFHSQIFHWFIASPSCRYFQGHSP
jgi:hypothetical protein